MTAAALCPAPGTYRPLAQRLAAVRPASPAELSVERAAEGLWCVIAMARDPEAEFRALVNAAREMHHLYLRWRSYPDPAAADRAAADTAETLYWLAAYRIDTHITGATPDDDTVPF